MPMLGSSAPAKWRLVLEGCRGWVCGLETGSCMDCLSVCLSGTEQEIRKVPEFMTEFLL